MCVSTVAGQEDCWLLTDTLVQSVSLQLKVCVNIQCLALHSFTDLHPGKARGLVTNQLILVVSHNQSTHSLRIYQKKTQQWKHQLLMILKNQN